MIMASVNETSVNEIIESKLLSQSSINKFIFCQRRFKFSYIDGKRDTAEAGVDRGFDYSWLGNTVHRVLEDFYKAENFPSENDLNADAENKIEAVLLRLLDQHWIYGQPELHLIDAKSMMKIFSQREAQRWREQKDDPVLNFVPEFREYELKDEKLRLMAIVDALWVDKDGHINPYPRDYKTNKKPEITGEMKLQALITSMLINNLFEQMPTHFEFLFLRTNKSILYEITTERINKAIGKIEWMWKKIQEGDFPKNMTNCYWCPVKKYCEGENRCWL
jgi:CRISPR/Cas system-associated exonuclease Cas4 (RecB family)